jgi:hypothetical protein
MKILDSYWFTPMGGDIIGVVKVEYDYTGVKFYIGNVYKYPGEGGLDKKKDEITIAERGAKFPIDAGKLLIP